MIRQFIFLFAIVLSSAFCHQKNNQESFKAFTGKVLGNKVRLRAKPDIESHIIQQLGKNDLLLVLEDADQFWAVKPPNELKAYVFRSYILDDVVEANRVNIRLGPSVTSPVIGQLQAGDKIQGVVSSENKKWLEIVPPENTRFYVSKEFLSYAGGADYFISMERRKEKVTSLLDKAYTVYQEEIKTSFEEMTPTNVIDILQNIIKNYSDFPSHVYKAKKLMADFQEKYVEKKLTYLEEKSAKAEDIKDENLFPKIELPQQQSIVKNDKQEFYTIADGSKFWENVEKSLFSNWVAFHTNKTQKDFYNEQKANALFVSGIVQSYNKAMSNRPGDYILKDKSNIPVAFLYSTTVDLERYIGKNVKMLVSPRPNNHFAHPAYFVLDIR